MSRFSSKREKRLWLYTIAVLISIYSTLGVVRPLAELLRKHDLLEISFIVGCFMVVLTILTQGLKKRPSKGEIGVMIGVSAVYILMFVRMSIPEERTHLIEYSIVAILVYEALNERKKQIRSRYSPALIAIFITTLAGIIDEVIQAILPNRIFDPLDILFNIIAGLMAIGMVTLLVLVRKRLG